MRSDITTDLRVVAYMAFVGLVLLLLVRDSPWKDGAPATGGAYDAPELLGPNQDQFFHDTNVTLEWERLGYRFSPEIETNGTPHSLDKGRLVVKDGLCNYELPDLDPGPHDYWIYGLDSGNRERLVLDDSIWIGENNSAPIFWQAQINATYSILINSLDLLAPDVNIAIDHAKGIARVANLQPDTRYSYQVDQISPKPETTDPMLRGMATYYDLTVSSIEFPLPFYTYTIELTTTDDPDFMAPVVTFEDMTETRTDLDLPLLEPGEAYLWRVRATDGHDHTTGWSATGSFQTGTTNHLGQVLLEDWGAPLMILGGVLLATMIAGVYLAKDDKQELILPEYGPGDVLTALAPGEGPEPKPAHDDGTGSDRDAKFLDTIEQDITEKQDDQDAIEHQDITEKQDNEENDEEEASP